MSSNGCGTVVRPYKGFASKTISVSLLFFALAGCGKKPEAQAPPPPAAVEVKDLNKSTVQTSSEYVGNLEAKQKVALAPRVDGRIIKIAAREGDPVKKGDLIVELQLNQEQGQVNAAESQVNIQRANVSSAEADLRGAQADVASAEAAVEQSKADLQEQQAQLELAKTNLGRSQFLVKEGAQSQQVLDDRTTAVNAAQAKRDALKAAVNSSQKALSAAQEKVTAAGSAIAGQQAALKQAQTRVGIANDTLDYNRLTAPIDGTVGNIQPKVGDYVEAGDQVTSITKDDAFELNITVPIEQAADLKTGLPVEIIDPQGKAISKGNISFVSPKTDRNSQGILVKAAFNNDGRLRDDSFARARIIWSQKPGLLIPTEAVSSIAGRNFVFVAVEKKQKDGSTAMVAKQKPVELGEIQGQSYQVISGLESGDKIITSGILNLADGMPIDLGKETATSKAVSSSK